MVIIMCTLPILIQYGINKTSMMKFFNLKIQLSCVLGMWLLISGHVLELQTCTNLIIVGIIITIIGFGIYKIWQGLVIGFLGTWIFTSGIVLKLLIPINFFLVGFILAIIGLSCSLNQEDTHKVKKFNTIAHNIF